MIEYNAPTFLGKILSVWPKSPYLYSFDLDGGPLLILYCLNLVLKDEKING